MVRPPVFHECGQQRTELHQWTESKNRYHYLPCLGLSLGENETGGGGGSNPAAAVEGWPDAATVTPSFDAFELAERAPRGVMAFVEGAAVAVGPAAAAALSPSLRSFTSDGSTNSAVNSRPPWGGH